jgi:hypothetical protein
MAWPVSEAREAFSVSLTSPSLAPSHSLTFLVMVPPSQPRVFGNAISVFFRAISLFLGEGERQKEKKEGGVTQHEQSA